MWCPPGDEALAASVSGSAWFKVDPGEGEADGPLPVLVRTGVNEHGRRVCTGLILGDVDSEFFGHQPREINAAALRAIRLPELIDAAWATGDLPDTYGDAVRAMLAEEPAPLGVRRRQYDDDHYRRVAALYRRALAEAPQRPTDWLAEREHQTKPTLRRWLAEARRRGFLGTTTQGRAGETGLERFTEGLDSTSPTYADDVLNRIRASKEGNSDD